MAAVEEDKYGNVSGLRGSIHAAGSGRKQPDRFPAMVGGRAISAAQEIAWWRVSASGTVKTTASLPASCSSS